MKRTSARPAPATVRRRAPPPAAKPVAKGPFDPLRAAEYGVFIGCDEVGRGALCGPVVVAAVHFDPAAIPPSLLAALDDSKRLPESIRDELAPLIMRHASYALAAGSRETIDRINIRAATLAAMARAVVRLGIDAPVRVDGRDIPSGLSLPCAAVIGGDALVPQIAAASILAKTVRDRTMRRLGSRYPAYGWQRNVGYGTAVHVDAIARHGATAHHRVSFTPRSVRLTCA